MINNRRIAMFYSTSLLALSLGLLLLIIGMITADPFRSGLVGCFASPPSSSAFWLFLLGCLLVAVGACTLLDVPSAVD